MHLFDEVYDSVVATGAYMRTGAVGTELLDSGGSIAGVVQGGGKVKRIAARHSVGGRGVPN